MTLRAYLDLELLGKRRPIGRIEGQIALEREDPGVHVGPRIDTVQAEAATELEVMVSSPVGREVTEDVVEHPSADPGLPAVPSHSGLIAGVPLLRSDGELISIHEADELDIVCEERRTPTAQQFSNPSEAKHIGAPVTEDAGQGEIGDGVPVALEFDGVYRLLIGVEFLALRRRGFQHPAAAEEVVGVDLHIPSRVEVVGADFEKALKIFRQGGGLGRKPLDAADVFVVPLVIEVEVGLVLHDGTADAKARLLRILRRLGFTCLEERAARVELIVPKVGVGSARKIIGPGARDHVDDRPLASPELRRVLGGQHLELRNRVQNDPYLGPLASPEPVVVVVSPVEQIHVAPGGRSVGTDLATFERRSGGTGGHARKQHSEGREISVIGRELLDGPLAERASQLVTGHLDQGGFRGDGDHFRDPG